MIALWQLTVVLVLLLPPALLGAVWGYRQYRFRTSGRPWRWVRSRLGIGCGVEELARRLGVDAAELLAHVPTYRSFRRRKRSGGERVILAPEAATKKLQRAITHRLLSKLAVHPKALGFRKGHSIVSHAQAHAGQAVVLRLDVVDFFPSTSARRVERYFRRIGWDKHAAALLTKLTTYDGGLPQGAPTSPALSNLVNYYLDVRLTTLAQRLERRWPRSRRYPSLEARYSRYADDITFSLSRDALHRLRGKRGRGWVVRGLIETTRRTLKAFGYRLHTGQKLRVRRRHQRQVVTGLVVNAFPNLPRERRRQLRAARHRAANGRPVTFTAAQLRGWTALESMVARQRSRLGGMSRARVDRATRRKEPSDIAGGQSS